MIVLKAMPAGIAAAVAVRNNRKRLSQQQGISPSGGIDTATHNDISRRSSCAGSEGVIGGGTGGRRRVGFIFVLASLLSNL